MATKLDFKEKMKTESLEELLNNVLEAELSGIKPLSKTKEHKKTFEIKNAEMGYSITDNTRSIREVGAKLRDSMARAMEGGLRMPSHKIKTEAIMARFTDEDKREISSEQLYNLLESYSNKGVGQDVEVTTENLPANIYKELSTNLQGVQEIKWSNVRDLPGMAASEIRVLSRELFDFFGVEDRSKVKTIASFENSQLLNDPAELDRVLGFLNNNALKLNHFIQDFDGSIEGYAPQVITYVANQMGKPHIYIAVNESEGMGINGKYIYSAPLKENYLLEMRNKLEIENKSKEENKKPRRPRLGRS